MSSSRPWSGNWTSLAASLILGLSIVAGTIITTGTIDYVKTFNTSLLTVTGTAKKVVTSDSVKWDSSFLVNTTSSALQTGYAQMGKDKSLVQSFLTGHGVPLADITFSPVSMQQNYVNCQFNPKACNQFGSTSYQLTENVRVESSHVHAITALAQATNPLIQSGVVFSTQDIKYYYSKLSGLRTSLLSAATKDAQLRAESITRSVGSQVGQLVSVTTEPFQVTPVDSTQVSGGGLYDTTTITKKVTAIVEATFRLP